MEQTHILEKLVLTPRTVWEQAFNKCHSHIAVRLYRKTSFGAHCAQRLGMDAIDYYTGNAVKALYDGIWEWKYKKYSLEEQLIRIIDSMISEEVRKYKIEALKNNKTILKENSELVAENEDSFDAEDCEFDHSELLNQAIDAACENNTKYTRFIQLKKQGLDYDEISKEIGCSKNETYQMMETISRRAKKILISR
jgi:hypothetical protein